MYKEFKPCFYTSLDAEDNCYYFSGSGNFDGSTVLGDGVFKLKNKDAVVRCEYKGFENSGAARQRTTIENKGDKPLSVELLSSAYVTGIGKGGSKPWKEDRFLIYYTHSCWTGEAQWECTSPEAVGLYKTYNHGSQSSFRLSGQSSWSTCYHEPVVIVVDTELNKAWYAEIDCGHGWFTDVCIRGYRDDTELIIMTTDCFERNDGWHVELKKGESVSTCYSVTGCVDGGFEEALAELTMARREYMKTPFDNGVSPLCYNDYMNALWALPTKEKSLPLIDAAAKAGCEYYIMDAGWYSVNKDETKDLGMWEVDDSIFGDGGLQSIFDYVYYRGMKPGIWFEFESVGGNAEIIKEHPEYLLYRRGNPVGGGRLMFDFRQAGVRKHIRSRVKVLYDMGVRYIKNDYNANTGIGVDPDGAVSLHEHTKAFYDFIDDLRAEFPDLIIENCGSGAMRADMETLSHFHLQSVSDQEDYFRLPSIVSGTNACIPPERCGIWAYPYPTKIDFRESFVPTKEFADRFRDGKVTSYCMVTGLMGLMYLSGRIECADEFNMSLIKEATDIYKETRGYIAKSVPVYPTGTFCIDTNTVDCFGLNDREDRVLMLAVWNNSDEQARKQIYLSKYVTGTPEIVKPYPNIDGYKTNIISKFLQVDLPAGKSAVYVMIRY